MSHLEKKELHVCMGLNSCKNEGISNKNDCAGQGDCATAVGHPCHTLNACKGQGACGLFGTTEEFCHPGENDCRNQGSCGVPILASRFFMQGPNKGLSVWQLARKRFEEKRNGLKPKTGSSPQPFGPTQEYVNNLPNITDKISASCGQCGNRSCSYVNDKNLRTIKADERVLIMNVKSEALLPDTLSTCPKNAK